MNARSQLAALREAGGETHSPADATGALPESLDGRRARAARTRLAIVDALRSLNQDGQLRPTAAMVAERAGVSQRTVWQHFDDLEALFIAAGQRDYGIVMRRTSEIDLDQPLSRRIAMLTDQRAELFEELTPVWRAAKLQEPFSVQIQRNRDRLVRAGRDQLKQVFTGELATMTPSERRQTLNALQVISNWTAWEAMRTELGLSRKEATQTTRKAIARLLEAT